MVPARVLGGGTTLAVMLAVGAFVFASPGDSRTAALDRSLPPAHPSEAPSPGFSLQQECPRGYINRPEPNPHQNFYFTRGAYSSSRRGYGRGGWSTDFPKADRQFIYVLQRTLGWDTFSCENPITLDNPQLRRFPFLYMLEVGRMALTPPEVEGLRSYLLAGGFLFIDDFWDRNEWANFEREIRQVLPNHQIEDIPMDHLIFRIIYPIEEVLQVPNQGAGSTGNPDYYGECYYGSSCTPTIRGIFDDDGRLMVVMAHNSDLGDAWEWAEQPSYPYDRSNFAFSLAFNLIAYAMAY